MQDAEIIYYNLFHKISSRLKSDSSSLWEKGRGGQKSTPRSSLQLVGSAPTGPRIPDPGGFIASTSSVSSALIGRTASTSTRRGMVAIISAPGLSVN